MRENAIRRPANFLSTTLLLSVSALSFDWFTMITVELGLHSHLGTSIHIKRVINFRKCLPLSVLTKCS